MNVWRGKRMNLSNGGLILFQRELEAEIISLNGLNIIDFTKVTFCKKIFLLDLSQHIVEHVII